MWLLLSGLRISYLVRLIVNTYSTHLINKNTKFLQASSIEREGSGVKAYGITRQITLEFLFIVRMLLRNTVFQMDFLQKKNYLALFNLSNQVNFFNKVEYTNIFKGNGFLLYSDEVELNFFISLLEKISINAKVQFLLVSYKGLFIDQKRILFLAKIKNIVDHFRFFTVYLNKVLLFAYSFLTQVLGLTLIFLYDLLTFFFKNFFFFNSANNVFLTKSSK